MVRRALAAALAALALAPAGASAHALLQSTEPERGGALKTAPAQVTLRFNEAVEVNFGALRVYDSGGRQVQTGQALHPAGRQNTIAIKVRGGLPQGGYTVTYRVISADSHPVSGGFVYSIGSGGAGARSVDDLLAATQSGAITSTAFGAARAVEFAAIALGVGALLFFGLCWLPALRATASAGASWRAASEALARRLRLLLTLASVAGAVAAVLGILLQGATGEGTSLWSALKWSVVSDVLATKFGTVWGLGALAWVIVLALALVEGRRLPVLKPASVGATGLALPALRPALLALAVPLAALCVLPALGGHAGTESPRWLMLPSNLVHVVCISAWAGGIAMLVLALRSATSRLEGADRTRLLAATVARFSTLAGPAFALILASGVAQSLAAIDSWGELLDTAYGRAVLIKFALFCVLVGFGWVNRSRLLPALRDATSPGRAGLLLRRTLRGELAIAVVVLGVTGALATYPPADSVAKGPVSRSATLGPARLELTVDPAQVGPDAVHLYLFDSASGKRWDQAKEVKATAELPSKRIGSIEVPIQHSGPGHYTSAGATFGVAGTWRLTVVARVSEFDQFQTTMEVPIR